MAYSSIFDKIREGVGIEVYPPTIFWTLGEYTGYNGKLSDVISELKDSLNVKRKSLKDLLNIALHPPRIIRSMIECKIYGGDPHLVQKSIDLTREIYLNHNLPSERIDEFTNKIKQDIGEEYFNSQITQERDDTSWEAYFPVLSQKTVYKIISSMQKNQTQEERMQGDQALEERMQRDQTQEDILFVALANGGIAAGMDVFLRYCDMTKNSNSKFYAVRFSREKMKDREPQISKDEGRYLESIGHNKQIILFDEDSCSGKTIELARDFLVKNVFGERKIITMVNIDRTEYESPYIIPDESLITKTVTDFFIKHELIPTADSI